MTEQRWSVDDASAGTRLDKFLAAEQRLQSRSRAQSALERGKIFLNGTEVTLKDAQRRLVAGDEVRLWMDRPGSAKTRVGRGPRTGELTIVYEDETLVVVNKPPGLLTVPLERRHEAESVQDALVGHLRSKGKRRPLVVHRIDRDTSGLVVFATRADALGRLKSQFRAHEPERIYLAVVYGRPSPPSGSWRDHLVWDQEDLIQKATHARDPRGSEATLAYRVVEQFAETALLEIELGTGKRNQIRLQARLRGHTLVGEQRYVYGDQSLRPISFDRQALHAYRLSFRHPMTDRTMQFEAPIPEDIAALLKVLRKR